MEIAEQDKERQRREAERQQRIFMEKEAQKKREEEPVFFKVSAINTNLEGHFYFLSKSARSSKILVFLVRFMHFVLDFDLRSDFLSENQPLPKLTFHNPLNLPYSWPSGSAICTDSACVHYALKKHWEEELMQQQFKF